MPDSLTPAQRLAEHLLGSSLEEYVVTKRNARPRWPWSLIAEQLASDTNDQVVVVPETLRQWFGEKADVA